MMLISLAAPRDTTPTASIHFALWPSWSARVDERASACSRRSCTSPRARSMTRSGNWNPKESCQRPRCPRQTIPYGSIDQPRETARRAERYRTVHELMVGIDFEGAKRRLPRELFLAMQSVPEEEAAQVSRPIDEIDRMDDLSSQDKSYLLGYYLLDLVGKEFLAAVLEDPTRRAEYLLPGRARVTAARPRLAPADATGGISALYMAQALRHHEDYEHSTRTLTFQAESTATHTTNRSGRPLLVSFLQRRQRARVEGLPPRCVR